MWPLILATIIAGGLGIGVATEHGIFTGAAAGYVIFMIHCHIWRLE